MRATAEISSYGWAYSLYNDPDYDVGDTYTIPVDEEVVWILCDEAIIGALQVYDGAGWVDIEVGVGAAAAVAANKPLLISPPLYSFGGTATGSVRVADPSLNNADLTVCTRKWEQI